MKITRFIVLAVHGYNDYSNAFKIPGNIFKEKISLIAYDLDGFGKNSNSGYWFSLNHQIKDLQNEILNLKTNFEKKIFLMGESMGGAIVVSLANQNKTLPIGGSCFSCSSNLELY